MSQSHNSVEPNVIDDEMIQKAIEEQYPEDIGQLAKKEGTDFKDVTELQLSFRNILQIDNLWQFENLTKLQLDNNIIEKIEALECLVHLVWLDLSFNNIEVIEGLDTLVKLQDLSLYNNRISKIEHMDTLQELQIFSIGKNNLTTLEDVIYLRRFKNLRTLNLTGNPLCDDERYMLFVVAYLPNLMYLDFKLVSDSTREAAVLEYQDRTDLLEGEEAQVLAELEEKQAKQQELEYHKTAFVEYLNGSFLFDNMYEDDTEAAKLASLPGVSDLLQKYREEFVSVCENLFNFGLKEYEKREAEVSEFCECRNEALTANQQESRKLILDFENRNKMTLDEIHNAGSSDIAESKRAEYKADIHQLSEALMTLEILIADQMEELANDFKGNMAVVASTFIENIKGIMNQCRDLENRHHEKLLEICITTLEKSVKNELEEDLPDEVRMLLVDKNTIVNAANVSHGVRLRKIDMRESDIFTNTYRWQASVTEKAFQNEVDRNREHVKEILQYIDSLQEELHNMETLEPME
ncbi:dynein regulatory complex subunit 3 isoform X1 [Columba livia]|uniref:Dynein regulatory complex subunit 3 n=1 Tax=Columba livia TaxID=8932 RepID=A0A2I0LTG9_COLLI|nr:dynein regulatory complex subunit 3 isoform X1 [Columba livia]XP_021146138.1 dynein regulatory complex subunit 3 isoform X1 [Columba livia]PKK20718.1 leucine rich repeat containing 48 [Columba livia]